MHGNEGVPDPRISMRCEVISTGNWNGSVCPGHTVEGSLSAGRYGSTGV